MEDTYVDKKEVKKVDKVFVDKSNTFMDVDNVRWNAADIFLKTSETADSWTESKFRRRIFSKCYLWENFRTVNGIKTRDDIVRMKQEQMQFELRSRGYFF